MLGAGDLAPDKILADFKRDHKKINSQLMGQLQNNFSKSKFGADLRANLAKLQIPVDVCLDCGKYSDELVIGANANLGFNIQAPKIEMKPVNLNL